VTSRLRYFSIASQQVFSKKIKIFFEGFSEVKTKNLRFQKTHFFYFFELVKFLKNERGLNTSDQVQRSTYKCRIKPRSGARLLHYAFNRLP